MQMGDSAHHVQEPREQGCLGLGLPLKLGRRIKDGAYEIDAAGCHVQARPYLKELASSQLLEWHCCILASHSLELRQSVQSDSNDGGQG